MVPNTWRGEDFKLKQILYASLCEFCSLSVVKDQPVLRFGKSNQALRRRVKFAHGDAVFAT